MQQGRSIWIALGLVLLVNLLGLAQITSSLPLHEDGDTAKMLDEIRASGGLSGSLRWLTGDWMLENHFYRPITGLSMSMDYALYGEKGWGYRLTNWLLSLLTAFGLYYCLQRLVQWAGFELRATAIIPLSATLAFSLQQTGFMHLLSGISAWWLVLFFLGARFLKSFLSTPFAPLPPSHLSESSSLSEPSAPNAQWLPALFAMGAILWGWDRITGFEYLRMIAWVPSRTALLMTCFALWAIVCLCRAGDFRSWKWLATGLTLFALAQGAYEQTMTLVPLIGLLAYTNRREWGRWAWAVAGGVASVALLYLSLRFALVPAELSGYQQQQIRSSGSAWAISFIGEIVPIAHQWHYWQSAGFEPTLWLFKQPWDYLMMMLAYIGVLWTFTRRWRWFGACLLWQFLTFLPMSFLHWFEHYAYLPQIGKNALDVGLLWLGASTLYINGLPLARRTGGQAHRQSSTPLADE
jgi:hypothetical protein